MNDQCHHPHISSASCDRETEIFRTDTVHRAIWFLIFQMMIHKMWNDILKIDHLLKISSSCMIFNLILNIFFFNSVINRHNYIFIHFLFCSPMLLCLSGGHRLTQSYTHYNHLHNIVENWKMIMWVFTCVMSRLISSQYCHNNEFINMISSVINRQTKTAIARSPPSISNETRMKRNILRLRVNPSSSWSQIIADVIWL